MLRVWEHPGRTAPQEVYGEGIAGVLAGTMVLDVSRSVLLMNTSMRLGWIGSPGNRAGELEAFSRCCDAIIMAIHCSTVADASHPLETRVT